MKTLALLCFIPFIISCTENETQTHAQQILIADSSEIVDQVIPQTLPGNQDQTPTEKIKNTKVLVNKPKQTEDIVTRMSASYPNNLFLYPDKNWNEMTVSQQEEFLISERISLELGHSHNYLSNGMRSNELPDAVTFTVRYTENKKEQEVYFTVIRKPGERHIKISDSDGVCGPMYKPVDPREFEYEVRK